MRLRLQTTTTAANSTLPQLKAWFSFLPTDDFSEQKLIIDLKKSICSNVRSFVDSKVKFHELGLTLDGFELLDEVVAEEVLREGDLIVVKEREQYQGIGKKRKAEDEGPSKGSSKRLRPTKPSVRTPHPVSSSSEESSSSSDSDSSSTSDSESSSSSDSSDSDSDSSSDEPPLVSTKPVRLPKPSAPQDHVPPGLGSTRTRKRNMRRRLKKKYDAAPTQETDLSIPLPLHRMSAANLAPLGTSSGTVPDIPMTDSRVDSMNDLTMFSLGNKNKKKGYKYALVPPTTKKKVFEEEGEGGEAISSEALDGPLPPSTSIFTTPSSNEVLKQRQARVVPPSELEAIGKLPKNMFVTSVDVEEDLWNNQSRKKKKQHKKVQEEEVYEYEAFETEATVLDYGDAEATLIPASGLPPVGSDEEETKSSLVWSVVEKNFDTYPQTTLTSLQTGQLVAWKALALNPETFSPEILLHIATVTTISFSGTPSADDNVSVHRLIRPGWEDLDMEDIEGTFGVENIQSWKTVDDLQRR